MEFSLFFFFNSEMGIRAIWSGGVKKEGRGGEGRWGWGWPNVRLHGGASACSLHISPPLWCGLTATGHHLLFSPQFQRPPNPMLLKPMAPLAMQPPLLLQLPPRSIQRPCFLHLSQIHAYN